LKTIEAQEMRSTPGETPAKSAEISDRWLADVIAMLHAVAGDLSEDNRIMALAAQSLILSAPRLSDTPDGIWRDWFGGEMPVGFHDIVEVKFRDETYSGTLKAGEVIWDHDGTATDIVSFVIVERAHGN